MKKLLLTAFLIVSSICSVLAAIPASPILYAPVNEANFQIQKPITFSWSPVRGATKYRIVFSTDRDFSYYDSARNVCVKENKYHKQVFNSVTRVWEREKLADACFIHTVRNPRYAMIASYPILSKKSRYYWGVRSVGTSGSGAMNDVRAFSIFDAIPPKILDVWSQTQTAKVGDTVNLFARLDSELASQYSLQVRIAGAEGQNMSVFSGETTTAGGANNANSATANTGATNAASTSPANINTTTTSTTAAGENDSATAVDPEFKFVFEDKPTASGERPFEVVIINNADKSIVDSFGDSYLVSDEKNADVSSAGTSFTDIDSEGYKLSKSSQTQVAAYVKDSATGLIWEIKSDDDGLRDKDWTYSWYLPDANMNGGYSGTVNGGVCKEAAVNTCQSITDLAKKTECEDLVKRVQARAQDCNSYKNLVNRAICQAKKAPEDCNAKTGAEKTICQAKTSVLISQTTGCDTNAYVNAVNRAGMCGARDWRLPTKTELAQLSLCASSTTTASNTSTNTSNTTPPVTNTNTTPSAVCQNQTSDKYWTSTTLDGNSDGAWVFDFAKNEFTQALKYVGSTFGRHAVRLVRSGGVCARDSRDDGSPRPRDCENKSSATSASSSSTAGSTAPAETNAANAGNTSGN